MHCAARQTRRLAFTFCLYLGLSACGGGSTTTPDYSIGGSVTGLLTSSPPLAFGHRLRGKDGDSYGAQARHPAAPESLRWVPAAGGMAAPLT